MQQELRRLAHRAHEQEQTGERECIGLPAKEIDRLAGKRGRLGEYGVEIDRAGEHEQGENAERKSEIADPIDDEGLDRGRVCFRLVVPEADQKIAREADAFPAEEQLHQVVRRHQHQHGEGEHRQIAEEARPVRVLAHVADGIKVHESRHRVHHHQHYCGERVDAQRPLDLEIAGSHPGKYRHAHVVMAKADIHEGNP